MTADPTGTRIPCSKKTRRRLSRFKRSPDNWDTTLRRVAALAEEAEQTEADS